MASNRTQPIGTTTYTPEMDQFILEKHAEKVPWSEIARLFNAEFHKDGHGTRKAGALQVRQQRLKGRADTPDINTGDRKPQHVTASKFPSKAEVKEPKAVLKRQREGDYGELNEGENQHHDANRKSPISTRSKTVQPTPSKAITLRFTPGNLASRETGPSSSSLEDPKMPGNLKESAKAREGKTKKAPLRGAPNSSNPKPNAAVSDDEHGEGQLSKRSIKRPTPHQREHRREIGLADEFGEDSTEEESSGSDHPDEVWLEYVKAARLDKHAPRQPPLRPKTKADFDGFPPGRYVIDPLSPILINNAQIPPTFLENWDWDQRTLLFVHKKDVAGSFTTRARRPGDPVFSKPSDLLAREEARENSKKRREAERARMATLPPLRSDVYGNTWVIEDPHELSSSRPGCAPRSWPPLPSADGFFQLPAPNVSALRSTLLSHEREDATHFPRKRQRPSSSHSNYLHLEPLSPPANAKVIIGNKVMEWFTDGEMAAMAQEEESSSRC